MPLPTFDLALPAFNGTPVASCACRVPIQTYSEWCWAAVVEGLWAFLGSGPARPQCQVAAGHLDESCCDPAIGGHDCNIPIDLRYPMHRANLLAGEVVSRPLNYAEIVQELIARTPPAVRISNGMSGHYLVITALYDGPKQGETTLRLSDPTYGEVFTRLSDLTQRWTDTYRTQRA